MDDEIGIESEIIYSWKLGQDNKCEGWIWNLIGIWEPSLYVLGSIHEVISSNWFDDGKN